MEKPTKSQMRALMSYLGRRSASKLTPLERSARAKKAVAAREAKRAAARAA
jgi:hypothetical protein